MLAQIRDYGLLYEDEHVDYFYSYGMVDWLAQGVIISNFHVINFYKDKKMLDENGEPTLYYWEVPYEMIHDIELTHDDDFLGFVDYVLYFENDEGKCDYVDIFLSKDRGRHERAIEAVKKRSNYLGQGRCTRDSVD